MDISIKHYKTSSVHQQTVKTLIFSQGSDPRAVTCRGKLQSRRCKLNQEINKELRLRAGAENLYKVCAHRTYVLINK